MLSSDRPTTFETLEHRRLLSATLRSAAFGAAVTDAVAEPAAEIVTVGWGGRDVEVFADRWVATFDDPADAAKIDRAGVRVAKELGSGAFLLETSGKARGRDVLAATRPLGATLEPDLVYTVNDLPDDPLIGFQWGVENTGQEGGTAGADISAREAWATSAGAGSVVAVIDTGVQLDHPDLAANIFTNPGEVAGDGIDNDGNGLIDDVTGWDFFSGDNDPSDIQGHGTHVAGTVAAVGDNGVGVAGVAYEAQVLPLKVGGGGRELSLSAIVSSIYYTLDLAAAGANVVAINASFGDYTPSVALFQAIEAAGEADVLFVASAGNDGLDIDNDNQVALPAGYSLDNIVSVGSTTRNESRSSFSNFGATRVDLGAPGSTIASTTIGGNYGYKSGTSMAAPHVAGAVAVLAAANPDASAAEIKAALLDGADPVARYDNLWASGGRLNLASSLSLIAAPATPVLAAASDTGASATDGVTRDNTPTFTGRAAANSQVTVLVDGVPAATATTDATGAWSATLPELADGSYDVGVRDASGRESDVAAVVIDTVAPAVLPSFVFETRPLRLTFDLSESLPNFGLVVTNLDDGSTYADTDATGSPFDLGDLPDGNYRATTAATDLAGNAGGGEGDFWWLAGDANRDRRVDGRDVQPIRLNLGNPGIFSTGDLNGDGRVDGRDVQPIRLNLGNTLPPII